MMHLQEVFSHGYASYIPKIGFMQIDLIVLSWIPHILFSVQRQLTRLKQHLCYKQLLFVLHLQF